MPTNRISSWLMLAGLWLCASVAYAGTVTYVYTDPQGTPLAEADASGNVTARFEYTPYGVSVPGMGAAPNGVGYTGHVNDPESGFVYMQTRYYDAEVGRFLSIDPVTPYEDSAGAFNRYWYAYNNPNRYTDPDGRCPICIVGVIAVRFAVGASIDAASQHYVEGKAWKDVDVGDTAVAGAVSAAIPGVGNLAKTGYQGTKAVVPAAKAIARISSKSANTANRAIKNSLGIVRNVGKIEAAAADIGKATIVAGTHQVVKAVAQSSTPEVKASEVKDAVKPTPPPPPVDDNKSL